MSFGVCCISKIFGDLKNMTNSELNHLVPIFLFVLLQDTGNKKLKTIKKFKHPDEMG